MQLEANIGIAAESVDDDGPWDASVPVPRLSLVETASAPIPWLTLVETTSSRTLGNWIYARFGKRLIDLLGALVLLLIVAPVILFVALAVRAKLGSPVIFRQRRVGRDGKVFTLYKFRSMAPDRRVRGDGYVGIDRRRTHKSANDPRLGPFGAALRKWSLDELPQLVNVILGQMSLVGPRPELVELVDRYEPWQHLRHQVRPGLTGLWQVEERASGPMHEHTDTDLVYVKRISLLTDLGLLVRTLPALLSRRGQGI